MLRNLLIEAPSGERFEVAVPLDKPLLELAEEFARMQGWGPRDEHGRPRRLVVEHIMLGVAVPLDLDTFRTLDTTALPDGALLRIYPEGVAAPSPPRAAGPTRASQTLNPPLRASQTAARPPAPACAASVEEAPSLIPVARAPQPAPDVIRRHTDVSFPGKVRAGQATNLRVRIVVTPGRHAHDIPLDLQVRDPSRPLRVTVYVAAENFTIEGETQAEIVVPLQGDSPPVHFRLTGEEPGPGRIMLDFVQDGRPLGSVDLAPVVVAEAPARPPEAAAQGEVRLRDQPGPAPDVTITVHEYRYSPGRLHFSLFSSDPRLRDLSVVMHGDLGTVDLHNEVVDWLHLQLEALNGDGTAVAAAADARRLGDVGNRLFQQLLPEKLQALCWTFHERGVRSVMVFSDEPHVPWELVKPWRLNPATGAAEQLPFWGESFALGRWLRGPATTERFSLGRICAVAAGGAGAHRDIAVHPASGAAPGLESADQELAVLRSLEGAGARVRVLPPRREAVRQAFEQAEFTLFHLVSHGAFGGAAADASAVLLEDGTFRAGELAPGMAAALRRRAPLVVFNACSTGRTGYSLTRLGSWGAELVHLGCGGFVGTLWRVTDTAALVFARSFYRSLAEGTPIGEALRQARLAVRREHQDDPTWLAYCCFADPMARLARPAAPEPGGIGPAVRPR